MLLPPLREVGLEPRGDERMSRRFICGLRDFSSEPSLWRLGLEGQVRPLAELLIDDEELRVCLRSRWRWLRRLARRFDASVEWEAALDSVTAEPFGNRFASRGVLLSAPDRPRVVFWCSRRTQRALLDVFVAH